MLLLINTNRMTPPIAPLGIEYVAGALSNAGHEVEILDLCLAEDPEAALRERLAADRPRLVGLSFRNVDDCFWPSCRSFLGDLKDLVERIRTLYDGPVVLGGVGYSVFARRILEHCGADFGVHGDGEGALTALLGELAGRRRFERVGGLVWRDPGEIRANAPNWPRSLTLPTSRVFLDNRAYFQKGGQAGLETKRGCDQSCVYCADPLAKGPMVRLRDPAEVADEAQALLSQGVDVLHLCDAEFNIPVTHARAVCDEFVRRRLGGHMRWYAYLAVTPFDAELAAAMARAGCVGINFTGDSGCQKMLTAYRKRHRPQDIATAVRLCKEHGITVMIDLLLGGPGETPRTAAESIAFLKQAEPDCVGAPLGLRVYPGTPVARLLAEQGPMEANPGIVRRYDGPVDLLQPTFYVSPQLGSRPAALIADLIAGDERFFTPQDADAQVSTDHNYNDHAPLLKAISAGARGAYWDILRKL